MIDQGYKIFESAQLARDGMVIPVEMNARLIDYKGGKAVLCASRDVTQRKKTEDELLETRNYLESIFNYANAPIIVSDPAFRISKFNHAFERLTGYQSFEVLGHRLEILFPIASRDATLSKIERTLSGEYWDSVEIPILRKDGDIRIVLWNSANIYAKDGERLLATVAQGTDITERKRAEDAMKDSERLLADIINFLPDATLVIDKEGRVIAWNRAIEALTGIPAEEILGKGGYEYALPFYGARRPILIDLKEQKKHGAGSFILRPEGRGLHDPPRSRRIERMQQDLASRRQVACGCTSQSATRRLGSLLIAWATCFSLSTNSTLP